MLLCSAIGACATAPQGARVISSIGELPTIQQEKADLLAQVRIGMSLSAFRTLVPDAYLVAQNADVTAYEISEVQKYVTRNDISRQNIIWGAGSPTVRTYKQVLWFYFRDGQLKKWGEPQDWQPRSETNIPITLVNTCNAPLTYTSGAFQLMAISLVLGLHTLSR